MRVIVPLDYNPKKWFEAEFIVQEITLKKITCFTQKA